MIPGSSPGFPHELTAVIPITRTIIKSFSLFLRTLLLKYSAFLPAIINDQLLF